MKVKLSGKRRALNVIVLILAACCFAIGGICIYFENILGNIHFEKADAGDISEIVAAGSSGFDFGKLDSETLYHDPAVLNIVLFSLDNYQKGDDTYGRSDSTIMLSIDTRNEEIKMTSFMRDMYVEIPGYGFDRINAAFAYGGPTLAVATLENNFRVDIDRYVIIDFKKFVDIIDSIGGIDMEITQEEADVINAESGEKKADPVSAGKMHLTGKQTRMYARIRKIDDDFHRTERQRKVISVVIDKLKSMDILTLNSHLAEILGMITTDMNKDEALNLATNLVSYLKYKQRTFRLPEDGNYYDETVSLHGTPAMILVPNLQGSISNLVKFVYGADNIPSVKGDYTLPQYGSVYPNTLDVSNQTKNSQTSEDNQDNGIDYDDMTDDGGHDAMDDGAMDDLAMDMMDDMGYY